MSVYFISDTHFGHENVHEGFRPCFSSTEEHDRIITDNVLSECSSRDTLWILGDVVINRSSISYLKEICDRIEIVRVVLGNHDGEQERKNNPSVTELMRAGVSSVHGCLRYKAAWLTHIPMNPVEFNRNPINIHGHVHGHTLEDKRFINVSCEAVEYRPVEYNKLVEGLL